VSRTIAFRRRIKKESRPRIGNPRFSGAKLDFLQRAVQFFVYIGELEGITGRSALTY
jgi:hypothetical protein